MATLGHVWNRFWKMCLCLMYSFTFLSQLWSCQWSHVTLGGSMESTKGLTKSSRLASDQRPCLKEASKNLSSSSVSVPCIRDYYADWLFLGRGYLTAFFAGLGWWDSLHDHNCCFFLLQSCRKGQKFGFQFLGLFSWTPPLCHLKNLFASSFLWPSIAAIPIIFRNFWIKAAYVPHLFLSLCLL